MTRGEAISPEEARAYLILAEVGWAKRKIARVMRREEHAVGYHLDKQQREMRIAREMREVRA